MGGRRNEGITGITLMTSGVLRLVESGAYTALVTEGTFLRQTQDGAVWRFDLGV
jgi:hypothetical protein